METQQDDDSDEEASISVLDPDDDDDEEESSWGFLVLVEAILYIPVLVQSLWASLPRSFLWGEAVLLLFEKRSLPGWFQRCQSVVCKIDSHMWPPPSFLLLVAFTITALVVHPDGFTWVIVEKTRCVFLSAVSNTIEGCILAHTLSFILAFSQEGSFVTCGSNEYVVGYFH